MKKLFVFSCLFLYLFTTTEFKQFLKLPIFIEHYLEHKVENPNISLLEYLNLHYLEGFVVDDDVARDMQLPFRSVDHASFNSIIAIEPYLAWLDCTSPFQTYNEQFRLETSFDIPSSQFIASIWQPPRAWFWGVDGFIKNRSCTHANPVITDLNHIPNIARKWTK